MVCFHAPLAQTKIEVCVIHQSTTVRRRIRNVYIKAYAAAAFVIAIVQYKANSLPDRPHRGGASAPITLPPPSPPSNQAAAAYVLM